MRKLLVVLIGILFVGLGQAQGQIEFKDVRYEKAIKDAPKANKLILLDFTATWCGPCKLMERTTFKDSTLGDFVNNTFVPIKVDTDHSLDKNLSGEFKVSGIPTLIVIDPTNRKVLLRLVGYTPANRLLNELKRVVK